MADEWGVPWIIPCSDEHRVHQENHAGVDMAGPAGRTGGDRARPDDPGTDGRGRPDHLDRDYSQAATYLGRGGRPPPVDPPEKVARTILRAPDRSRRDISVGVANLVVVLGFRTLPAAYDRLVGPLMRLGGLGRLPVADHDGNVLVPSRRAMRRTETGLRTTGAVALVAAGDGPDRSRNRWRGAR